MYQELMIIGNLGGDPEMRYTPNGTAVTSFSVATSRKWGGDNPGEETVWFRVSAWGRQAETCNEYLRKGKQVMVKGRLTVDGTTGGPRVWTDANGNARASFEVRALNVLFLGGGQKQENPIDALEAEARRNGGQVVIDVSEDEIPF